MTHPVHGCLLDRTVTRSAIARIMPRLRLVEIARLAPQGNIPLKAA